MDNLVDSGPRKRSEFGRNGHQIRRCWAKPKSDRFWSELPNLRGIGPICQFRIWSKFHRSSPGLARSWRADHTWPEFGPNSRLRATSRGSTMIILERVLQRTPRAWNRSQAASRNSDPDSEGGRTPGQRAVCRFHDRSPFAPNPRRSGGGLPPRREPMGDSARRRQPKGPLCTLESAPRGRG